MKIVQLIAATVALVSLSLSNAYARDRFNVDINIGAYDYVAPQITHYPNTVYYGRTPTVIYYSAPPIVQYVPVINVRPYLGNGYYNNYHDNRYQGNYHRNERQNYYKDWNNGWRGNAGGNRHHDRGGHRSRD